MCSLKVLFSSSVYLTIDPGTCRFSVLFGGNFVLPLSGPCSQDFLVFSLSRANSKRFFYTSPRICSSVQNKEEPPAHFKKRFCLFLTRQKVTMVLKTL